MNRRDMIKATVGAGAGLAAAGAAGAAVASPDSSGKGQYSGWTGIDGNTTHIELVDIHGRTCFVDIAGITRIGVAENGPVKVGDGSIQEPVLEIDGGRYAPPGGTLAEAEAAAVLIMARKRAQMAGGGAVLSTVFQQ